MTKPAGAPAKTLRARVWASPPVVFVRRSVMCVWAVLVAAVVIVRALLAWIWHALCVVFTPATYPRLLLYIADRDKYLEPLEGFRFFLFFASLFYFAISTGQALPMARVSHSIVLVSYAALGLLETQRVRVSMIHVALATFVFNAEMEAHTFWMSGALAVSVLSCVCAIFHSALEMALTAAAPPK